MRKDEMEAKTLKSRSLCINSRSCRIAQAPMRHSTEDRIVNPVRPRETIQVDSLFEDVRPKR
jgi:hypothetical protein